MSNSAIKFGAGGASLAGLPTSLFGALGGNPSINALTNANAMAAQQAAAGQANLAMQAAAQPEGSGTIMDASMPTFDPAAQMAGMGIFGARGARNRSLFGRKGALASAFMKKALGSEPNVDPCSEEFDYEIASDYGHSAEDIKKYREANCKSGSPAQDRGETYEEFKKRTGETSMKAYMRDNPRGSK